MFSSHVEPEKNIPVTKKKPQSVFSKVTFIYLLCIQPKRFYDIKNVYFF